MYTHTHNTSTVHIISEQLVNSRFYFKKQLDVGATHASYPYLLISMSRDTCSTAGADFSSKLSSSRLLHVYEIIRRSLRSMWCCKLIQRKIVRPIIRRIFVMPSVVLTALGHCRLLQTDHRLSVFVCGPDELMSAAWRGERSGELTASCCPVKFTLTKQTQSTTWT